MPRIGDKQEFEVLEPGVYLAELIDYTDQTKDGQPLMSGTKFGDPKPQWRFTFELLDYPEDGRQISAWVNKPKHLDNIAPNANLTLIATALLGVAVGDEWELADLLHKKCRLQVENYTKQDGTEAHAIGKYYPAKQPRAEAAPRRAATVATKEEVPF